MAESSVGGVLSPTTVTVEEAEATPNWLLTTQVMTAPLSATVKTLVKTSPLAKIWVPFLNQEIKAGVATPTLPIPRAVYAPEMPTALNRTSTPSVTVGLSGATPRMRAGPTRLTLVANWKNEAGTTS